MPAVTSDRRTIPSSIAPKRRLDLLSIAPVRWLVVSPFYPGVFQAVSVAIFGLVVYYGFAGTFRAGHNFATTVTWTLWWAILPISFILVGRAWCAVCPIIPGMSLVQRVVGPGRMPGLFLRRYGIWLMGLGFVYLTWTERIWGITSSPQGTAVLLLALLGVGIAMAALYKGRAFCRYVCPIGALCGLYSMTAVTELRSKGTEDCQACDKQCFRGDGHVDGCPLYQYTRTMDTNRNCNLCAQCVKSCPHSAVEWRLRVPGRELWQLREPYAGESLLVLLLVGMVYVQTIDMTTAWSSYMRWFLESTPVDSYEMGFSLTFAFVLASAVGLYLLATRWSGSATSWRRNFKTFGYAYIPLVLAVHLGHNAMHLISEGPSAVQTAAKAVLAPVGIAVAVSTQEGTSDLSLVWMIPFVILGGAASLYVVWRTSRRLEGQGEAGKLYPHLILVMLLIGLFVQLFLFPMNPRHAH